MIGVGAVGAGPVGALIGSGMPGAIASADEPWWRHAPLVDSPGNTRAHVVWRNGSLVDLAGNTWSTVGTPGYTQPVGYLPPGGSSFSGANHYELPAPNAMATAGLLGMAVLKPTTADVASTTMVLSMLNTGGGPPGWQLVANEVGLVRWFAPGQKTSNPLTANQVNVIGFGCSPAVAYSYLRVNQRSMGAPSGGGVLSYDGTEVGKIGCHFDNLLGFAGTIYEIWVGNPSGYIYPGAGYTQAGVNALFQDMATKVFQRLRVTAPA